MDKIELEVSNREILGKRVKHLRRQGITPIHVFGHGIQSLALQCNTSELERVLSQAGHTGLVNLKLRGEKKPRTVVTREISRDWRDGKLLHVDFYQVRMEEKLKVEVPVVLVGEAPALKSKANTLKQEVDSLTVECLPAEIPAHIEVNVSSLAEAEQAIRVKDIHLAEGITILSDPELIVARVVARPVEVVEEKAKPAEEAAASAEAAEGSKEKVKET